MIGTSPRRKEDQRLLSGAGRFVDDLTRDGLLHLGVVRSAEAHARIARVALERARTVPGVVAAWSAADLDGIAPHMPTAYGGSQKGRPWSQPVLARGLVRFVGEAVAVVVAESPYALADGLEAAVEAVLGDRLQWVVVERFEHARAAVIEAEAAEEAERSQPGQFTVM